MIHLFGRPIFMSELKVPGCTSMQIVGLLKLYVIQRALASPTLHGNSSGRAQITVFVRKSGRKPNIFRVCDARFTVSSNEIYILNSSKLAKKLHDFSLLHHNQLHDLSSYPYCPSNNPTRRHSLQTIWFFFHSVKKSTIVW
jgi:hypothetical protein